MKLFNYPILVSFWLTLPFIFNGCSSDSSGGTSNTTTPAVPYCGSVSSYSSAVTITGSAEYEFRTNGNGAVATPNPIRRAEVRVTSSSGSIVQCGETDASGNFSLQLPNNDSTVTITVASRADNNYMKAYIMNNPTNNDFYGVATTVTLDGSKSVGTLTAPATGTIIGGAFNILDKILDANDFLRTETNNCSATFTNCVEVSVAPMVDVYWEPGLNPGDYFGLPALSFYIPDNNQLYILGGVNGNVDDSDTDHFDDSIILHEYGHAIESLFSIADSPGGTHNGDNILDPRLAWGEGWANYFQAAVTGNPVYRDTFGTTLGTSGVFVNENLESGTSDTPTEAAEGNFREFSISRVLWDLTDADEMNATDDLQTTFSELWTIFAATTNGFADPSQNFRSAGLFYELQSTLVGRSNWNTILTAEEQLAARTNYANTLSNGTSCPTAILAEDVPNANVLNNPGRQPEDGTSNNSNQFKSNDFYQIAHTGGSLTINLSYTTTSTNAADLDIYLYANDYTYGSAASGNLIGLSENTVSNTATSGSESISVSSLSAGTYMLNVRYDTTGGVVAADKAGNYSLTVNGQSKCPD